MIWPHMTRHAEFAVHAMRRMGSAIRAVLLTGPQVSREPYGRALHASQSQNSVGVLQLAQIERFASDLRAMKPHDPRRGRLTDKVRSLRHEILKAGPNHG